jgi:hypothetical protein
MEKAPQVARTTDDDERPPVLDRVVAPRTLTGLDGPGLGRPKPGATRLLPGLGTVFSSLFLLLIRSSTDGRCVCEASPPQSWAMCFALRSFRIVFQLYTIRTRFSNKNEYFSLASKVRTDSDSENSLALTMTPSASLTHPTTARMQSVTPRVSKNSEAWVQPVRQPRKADVIMAPLLPLPSPLPVATGQTPQLLNGPWELWSSIQKAAIRIQRTMQPPPAGFPPGGLGCLLSAAVWRSCFLAEEHPCISNGFFQIQVCNLIIWASLKPNNTGDMHVQARMAI